MTNNLHVRLVFLSSFVFKQCYKTTSSLIKVGSDVWRSDQRRLVKKNRRFQTGREGLVGGLGNVFKCNDSCFSGLLSGHHGNKTKVVLPGCSDLIPKSTHDSYRSTRKTKPKKTQFGKAYNRTRIRAHSLFG